MRTETLPSELAHATIGPSSRGAHPIAFTAGQRRCMVSMLVANMACEASSRGRAERAVGVRSGGVSSDLPDALWSECSLTFDQPFPPSFSFQMNTLPSNEQEARMLPKEG